MRILVLLALLAVAAVASSDAPPPTGTGQTGTWRAVRALDLGAAAPGAVALSPDQEFAAVCGADGSLTILRVTLYPNLYPDWPYLVYGWHPPPGAPPSPDPAQDALPPPQTLHCSMAQRGAR
ncbi:hypothetical protein T484DRAFT_1791721, partial [Baffinella frigidus]